ncbi:MAG: hypothetical protein NTW21_27250 [Verrucomicrobia bacterium]|nr:hypothetical protein [Verrucomicrobiota bacterium]
MRDWPQVTRDYLAFAFDFDKKGEHLPLIRWTDESRKMIWMPAYIGNQAGPESINLFGAIVSGALVGMDMRDFRGTDWVAMAENFHSPQDGIFLDWIGGSSGNSFWYDVLPNVLFIQIGALYPGDRRRDDLMTRIAAKWYDGCVALGGRVAPPALPDFDHTGLNLRTMQPCDNSIRIEPEGAAGIAWIEYAAWLKSKDERFLTAADWAIRALTTKPLEANPLYEVLLPYAALTAARMNAELRRDYQVSKLLNWCFEPKPAPQARPHWGVLCGNWNGLDIAGLVGSNTDGGGYAFAMNTFQFAGTLAPVARYDGRYAHDLGKWLLNAANAARLFYPNAHDAEHQSSHDWAAKYDPGAVVAYEGMRKWKRGASTVMVAGEQSLAGKIVAGNSASTHYCRESPLDVEVIEETPVAGSVRLEHVWKIPLPGESQRWLVVAADRRDGGHGGNHFAFSIANSPQGPFTPAFTISGNGSQVPNEIPAKTAEVPESWQGTLYVKVASTDSSANPQGRDQLRVDAMAISYQSKTGPFATGDLVTSWFDLLKNSTVPIVLYRPTSVTTDLGLYGSAHVGQFGGLVATTNVEAVLRWDLLKTDYFHAPAYPTSLIYNPHREGKSVEIEVGPAAVDIYDAADHCFVARAVQGKTPITMAPDAARVLVLVPHDGVLVHEGSHTLVNGVVIDYHHE